MNRQVLCWLTCSSSSGQRWYSYVSEICHEHQGQLRLAGALPFSWAYRQRSKISSWLLNFLWIYALFYPDLLSLLAMHECLFLVCALNKTEMYYKEQIPWTHYVPIASMLRLWESSRPWECFAAQAQLNSTHWKGSFSGFYPEKTSLNSLLPSSAFMGVCSSHQQHQSSFCPCEKSRWASNQLGLPFGEGGSQCHYQDHPFGHGSTGGWCRLLSPPVKEWRITTFKIHGIKKQIENQSIHNLEVFKDLLK